MGLRGDKALWEAESFGLELWDVTIGDLLDWQAQKLPEKEAIVYHYPELNLNLRLTYRQYQAQANQLAKGLLALGIEKGEHVAIWAPNLPEWIFLQMALAKIGAVCVTINTAYRVAELEYVLRQGDVTTLIMVEEWRGNSYLQSVRQLVPELEAVADPVHQMVQSEKLPFLKRVILLGDNPQQGCLRYSQILGLARQVSDEVLKQRQAATRPHDPTMIQYTSGTIGFPKGAVLTHHNLVNNSLLCIQRHQLRPDDRYITSMPFFHTGGCVLGTLWALVLGGTLLPLISFDPAKQLEVMVEERATITFAVPTMLIAMLNHPRFVAGEFNNLSMRYVISGGAPVPVALMQQIKEQMEADVGIGFGMTEASPGICTTNPGDSFELKSATAGYPLAYTEVKIVSPQTGEVVGFRETGEFLARGYFVMKGYYKIPEKSAETIDQQGWLHTGDLATMNPQGYLNIVGRLKDMIIRGGENLYPAEIEEYLMKHPAIAEAQVVGVPDKLMGEEAVAVLRLKPGVATSEADIRAYLQATISKHKVPRYVLFTNEFPMTVSGKVQKYRLRENLIEELRLS